MDYFCDNKITTATWDEIARNIINAFPHYSKIECIKLFRAVTNSGLKDAKDAIDAVWTAHKIEKLAVRLERVAASLRTTQDTCLGYDSFERRKLEHTLELLESYNKTSENMPA